MNINELPNPAIEVHHMFDATNEDIFQVVMGVKKVWEESESSEDDDAFTDPIPTQNEALQAAPVLQKYTEYLDNPFACNLETMLGSFGRRTRATVMQSMKDSKLTYVNSQCS